MKKLNKLSNVSAKAEPALVEDSLRLVDQNGEVGQSRAESAQVEAEQAKLIHNVKTEIQSEEDYVDQDQSMSVHHYADNSFDDGDQIMSEDDNSQAAQPQPDNNPKNESTSSTEKDAKDIRELMQQYTTCNQVGVQ